MSSLCFTYIIWSYIYLCSENIPIQNHSVWQMKTKIRFQIRIKFWAVLGESWGPLASLPNDMRLVWRLCHLLITYLYGIHKVISRYNESIYCTEDWPVEFMWRRGFKIQFEIMYVIKGVCMYSIMFSKVAFNSIRNAIPHKQVCFLSQCAPTFFAKRTVLLPFVTCLLLFHGQTVDVQGRQVIYYI